MKKIGVFFSGELSENKGGPNGYLYNLRQGLIHNSININFYTVNQNSKKNNSKKSQNSFSDKEKNFFESLKLEFKVLAFYIKKGLKCNKIVESGYRSKEILHVHSSEDVFYLRRFLNYKGKIIFTPHRPECLADETITSLQLKNNTQYRFIVLRFFLNYLERFSYKKSDAFIFPSENSMNIYNNFPGFSIHSLNKPIQYVFTGVPYRKATINREEYRKKLGIKSDDKMICFIGRHNYIKGYDLLVKLSDKLLSEDIYVYCAGANNGIKSPKNDKWCELGYVSDPFNLINAADIVVIPNRNTYFDLICIEVLSIGTPLLSSNTGGNLDIKKLTNGIYLFENGNEESLLANIKEIFSLKTDDIENISSENKTFYQENCSLENFSEKYILALNNIKEYLKM